MNIIINPLQWIGVLVVIVVLLLCYAIVPYAGGGLLICIDNAAFGLRWFGLSTPIAEWSVIGAVVGGLIALSRAFIRFGMADKTKLIVFWGIGCLVCLYVMSLIYTQTMSPVYQVQHAPVTQTHGTINGYTVFRAFISYFIEN
jgi:hypothetical protein